MICSHSFRPHENFSDEVNRNLVQSEIEGGVRLQDLAPGSALRIRSSDTGEAAGLALFAPANSSNGTIGTGILGLTGGAPSTGFATVGAKNGC
jgi:hypothetical protein